MIHVHNRGKKREPTEEGEGKRGRKGAEGRREGQEKEKGSREGKRDRNKSKHV